MNPKIITFLLGMSMFFTGAAGLVNEYVLSAVSTYILGNSIEQFSITIALMLGFMGLGGWVQKFVNDDNLVEKFLILEVILAILGGFSPLAIYSGFAFFETHFALIQYFFIISIGFLIGFEIPFIVRINEKFSQSLKENLSLVMGADYLGSLVGAFVWIYFLLPFLPLTKISFLISGVNLIVALITFTYIKKDYIKSISTATFVGGLLIFGYIASASITNVLENKLYQDPVVSSQKTKYQQIVITKNKSLNEYRLYINGNVQFSSLDERIYHEELVHPIMSLKEGPKDVLILGGGDGIAIREVKKHTDVKSITLIDLDPGMIQLAKTNPILKKINENSFKNVNIIDPNTFVSSGGIKDVYVSGKEAGFVNVINIDADKLLHQLKDKLWDVIIIDFPDPSSIELAKLYSKEFYMKLKRVLRPGGMFVIQSTSPYHAKESFLCIGRTIEAAGFNVIPYHDNVPSFGDWGWYIAWDKEDPSHNDIYTKINELDEFKVDTTYLTPNVFRSALVFGKNSLKSDLIAVNTLMYPKLLDIYTTNSWLVY